MEAKEYISTPIMIGNLPLGGNYPVRIQSMTNTDTLDTAASVEQIISIIQAGGEMVRLTAQGVREAENLGRIKDQLVAAGFDVPLVADIHFNPSAAETAASIVEKVRINPGNYVDKRAVFQEVHFTDKEYEEELERIHQRLYPLINICKSNNTVIRVGINHGSLSDRIMSRYGNTPEGMTASAMEFIRLFHAENFDNLVLSMKSSDTGTMVTATRMLVNAMKEEGFAYPLHLGVTEAGEGEDGRIRSAAGIGTLLSEGIGDTIRVSLSESPENEIPVAKEILQIISPDGRTKNISHTPSSTQPGEMYHPVVLTRSRGQFRDENGNIYNDKVSTVKSISDLPSVSVSDAICLEDKQTSREKTALKAAVLLGRFFISRQSKGICIYNPNLESAVLKDISFSILQATEARITRNRYVSCPTCGRTKYDLQTAVKKVKSATSHLTGLKIAVMGCVVNGPGEMAGADFGYVGAGEGKIHIYKGLIPVLKNVPEAEAIDRLLEVINSSLDN